MSIRASLPVIIAPARRLATALAVLVVALAMAGAASAQTTRIKDIADVEGVRDNLLVGYGLAVGLNGTGDSLNKQIMTRESLFGMLERLGVNARTANNDIRTKNVAAVIVTANLPPFAQQGTRIDVSVGTLGDATSLQGAILMVTPLMGADGEVYAVAQGPIDSGFVARGAAASITRGVPTSGRVPNGAIVEREVNFEMASMDTVRLSLRNPDFTTARRVAQAVNSFLGDGAAHPTDPRTIAVKVPANYKGDAVAMVTDIERLPVEPDQPARIVIDQTNGVIVIGENVRISTVAVAQGNLTIRVTETPQVSQPGPFAPGPGVIPNSQNPDQVLTNQVPALDANGRPIIGSNGLPVMVPQQTLAPGSAQGGQIAGGAQTVVVPRTQIEVDTGENRRLAMLPSGVTLGELVNGLNALGVGPRDLITILQTIKAAGALQADIETL